MPTKTPSSDILSAATGLLAPYFPGLNPDALLKSLREPRMPASDGRSPKALRRREAAEQLRISLPTLNNYVKRGYVKTVKLPRNRLVLIEQSEVDRLLGRIDGGETKISEVA